MAIRPAQDEEEETSRKITQVDRYPETDLHERERSYNNMCSRTHIRRAMPCITRWTHRVEIFISTSYEQRETCCNLILFSFCAIVCWHFSLLSTAEAMLDSHHGLTIIPIKKFHSLLCIGVVIYKVTVEFVAYHSFQCVQNLFLI